MRNGLKDETGVIDGALRSVDALLPDPWRVEIVVQQVAVGPDASRRADAVAALIGPEGTEVRFLVECQRSGTPTRLLLARLRELVAASTLPLLYVSDYIGPTQRAALAAEGVSYADGTGWVRVATQSPLILLTGQGASRSPHYRKSTAVVRLNGAAAGRIVRTLCVQDPPLGVRALAVRAEVSPGTVSKVLPTLAAEGVVERDGRGAVAAVHRPSLIRRWVQDYSFLTANGRPRYFIAPRGLDRTLQKLESLSAPVTLTGSAAARRLLPDGVTSVVPLTLLALYAESAERLAEELRLVPADPPTANVVVAAPQDRRVLAEPLAPAALVLADLLTLPGRSDAESEQLLDTLALTDPAWRE